MVAWLLSDSRKSERSCGTQSYSSSSNFFVALPCNFTFDGMSKLMIPSTAAVGLIAKGISLFEGDVLLLVQFLHLVIIDDSSF